MAVSVAPYAEVTICNAVNEYLFHEPRLFSVISQAYTLAGHDIAFLVKRGCTVTWYYEHARFIATVVISSTTIMELEADCLCKQL